MPVILKIGWLERSDNRIIRFALDKIGSSRGCSALISLRVKPVTGMTGYPIVIIGLLILLRCILKRSHKFSVSLDLPWGGLDVGAASEIYHKTKIGQPSKVHP